MSLRRAVVALLLLSMLTPAAPAYAAYSKTATDRDDSRSPLDIRLVTRTDANDKMHFEIATWKPFRARALNIDKLRYFWIGFDSDRRVADRSRFEYCVFVFFDGGLRWVATNCGNQLVAKGMASKPAGRVIRLTISMVALHIYLRDHEWAVVSSWKGTPCPGTCVDKVPNKLPLFLRDFTPPKISFAPPHLITQTSTSSSFPLGFSITDPRGSGVAAWQLHAMHLGLGGWTVADSGTAAGSTLLPFDGVEGATYGFYLTAQDQQGNATEGPYKEVVVPYDDDTVPGHAVSGSVTSVADPTAYGGTLSVIADTTSTYSFYGGAFLGCPQIWLIGPGAGDWTIQITWNVSEQATVSAADIPDGPRQVLWTTGACGYQYTVKLVSGSSVAIDAIGDASQSA